MIVVTLNDSIVEDAALEWLGEQTRYARTLTPALSHGEREEDGEVVQFRFAQTLTPPLSHGEREKRETIREMNPALNVNGSESRLEAVT